MYVVYTIYNVFYIVMDLSQYKSKVDSFNFRYVL